MSDHDIITTDNTSEPDFESEPIKRPSAARKVFQGFIALIFILATVYLFGGLHQYLQFRQTPTETRAGTYESVITEDGVGVPTTVFVVHPEQREGDTIEARRLVDQANQILGQAAVTLEPVVIETVSIQGDFSGPQLVTNPPALKELVPALDPDRLHVVVVDTLGGINGVAFSGQNLVAVAEYTTSFDFRVLAHEVGHALELSHVDDKANLMYSGSAGTELSVEQARTMHDAAQAFSRDDS